MNVWFKINENNVVTGSSGWEWRTVSMWQTGVQYKNITKKLHFKPENGRTTQKAQNGRKWRAICDKTEGTLEYGQFSLLTFIHANKCPDANL